MARAGIGVTSQAAMDKIERTICTQLCSALPDPENPTCKHGCLWLGIKLILRQRHKATDRSTARISIMIVAIAGTQGFDGI